MAQDWEQQVALRYENLRLAEVLQDLEQQYGIPFSYSPDKLPLNRRITFHSKDLNLRQALQRLLRENQIVHTQLGGLVVLRRAAQSSSISYQNQVPQKPKRQGVLGYDPHDALRTHRPQPEPPQARQYLSSTQLETYAPQKLRVRQVALQEEPLETLSLQLGGAEPQLRAVWREMAGDSLDFPFKVQFSPLPLLSTRPNNIEGINHFSLNLFWGLSGGLKGLELGGLGNSLRGDMTGMQVAGLVNTINGEGLGLQVAGLANSSKGRFRGIQVAGLSNMSAALLGIQVSGLSNISREAQGLQIAGLGNMASSMKGLQLGGIYNLTNGELMGAQFAGILNMAWNSRYAAQFAGIANYTSTAQLQMAGILNVADTVQGAQVGLVNVSKRVQGMQLGLINVVDSLQGVTLGLINIVRKNGYNHLEIGSNELLPVTGMFKMGGQSFYQNFIFGHRVEENVLGLGWGMGSRLPISPKAGLNMEVNGVALIDDWHWNRNELNLWGSFRMTGEWVIAKRFRLFAGPSFNVFVANQIRAESGAYGNSDLLPYRFFNETEGSVNVQMWVGGSAGIRF